MTEAQQVLPKAKKSVALSGTAAGNTALCTVGRTGNDLAYRGYDILDLATTSEFEEIAHLLVHGKLPNAAELAGYKAKLKALRGLPAAVKVALEQLPPSAHPMDVMRTGVSALGCALPEKDDHNHPGARDIADDQDAIEVISPQSPLGSALLESTQEFLFARIIAGKRLVDPKSAAEAVATELHGRLRGIAGAFDPAEDMPRGVSHIHPQRR